MSGLKSKKISIYKTLKFIFENILYFLVQAFALVSLDIVQFISWLIIGWTLYAIARGSIFIVDISMALSYGLIAVAYAFVWLWVLKTDNKYGLKWFYPKIVFAEIPLFIALYFVRKTPDPTLMMGYQPEPLCAIITAVILLPVYLILIRKYILNNGENFKKRFILICLSMLIAGLAIFISSFYIVHLIYHY